MPFYVNGIRFEQQFARVRVDLVYESYTLTSKSAPSCRQRRIHPSRGPKRGIELGPLVSLKVPKIISHFYEYLVTNTKYVILISLGINFLLSFFMAVS